MSRTLARSVAPTLTLLLCLLVPRWAAAVGDGVPNVQPEARIRPGQEAALERALRDLGLGCPVAPRPDCDFDASVDGAVIELQTDGGDVRLGVGAPAKAGCPSAPPPLWVCPASGSDDDRGTADAAARLLLANIEGAAALAAVWDTGAAPTAGAPATAGDGHGPGVVPPLSRLLDGMLLAWLLLVGAVVTVALRRLDRRARWTALATVAVALAARLAVPFSPANWYFAAAQEGPFPGVFTGSYPVFFDGLYRAVAALSFADDAWFFAGHIAVGTLAPLLFVVGALVLRGDRGWTAAASFGAFLALAPFLVWLSRSDAHHVWPFTLLGAAFLGFTLPSWRWGLPLALLSLVMGAGIRAETLPALYSAGLLVVAVGGFDRRRELRALATTAVATALAFAIMWGPFWSTLVAQQAGAEHALPEILASLTRVITLRDPAIPRAAWAAVVLPLAGLALVHAVVRRDAVRVPATILGILLSAAPVWLTGWSLDNVGHARYATLTWAYWLWLLALGLAAAHTAVARFWPRRGVVFAALLLVPAIPFAAALPELRGLAEWDAEYRFLREELAQLPPDCTVTTVFGSETNAAGPGPEGDLYDILLAHPHPLLALRFPDLHWRVVPPGETPPPPPDGCHAVLWGTACAAVEAGFVGGYVPFENLRTEAGRSCAALRAPIDGPPIAQARYPLKQGRYPDAAFPDGSIELRLWRTK